MATQKDEECCTGFSLPYDGITRTGSKGLSQLHQYWYGTPNDSSELTGITDFRQDAPDFGSLGDKFVPEERTNSAKVFLPYSVK